MHAVCMQLTNVTLCLIKIYSYPCAHVLRLIFYGICDSLITHLIGYTLWMINRLFAGCVLVDK